MSRRRWAVLAGSVAAAACVISAGATALAASQGPHSTARTHTNNQAPTAAVRPASLGHQTNNQAPARTGARSGAVLGTNVQKAARGQQTQRGSK